MSVDYLKELSEVQQQAVMATEGPSLIIAGAGAGKTRSLTYRIAHLLSKGVKPWNILALTFTNKAAKEMQERIASVVGTTTAKALWMGTFHSMFLRILKVEAQLLGYSNNFTIFDTTDTKSVLSRIIKELRLDPQVYKPNELYSRISAAKNDLITHQAYAANSVLLAEDRYRRKPETHTIYSQYALQCKRASAMDFDDLLLNTNLLLHNFPDVLAKYQAKFKYILVDEYQDTNRSQYVIVKELAAQHHNVCVVGDDAQSIYSFRGAKIENILNFRNDYPDYKLFKLEQNYRSTQNIVNAANSVIARNSKQIHKVLFSAKDEGEKVKLIRAYSDQEEGLMVATAISEVVNREHVPYNQIAILYRTNAQSRIFEEALRKRNIPYRIYAGHSFYERKEIKDVLAYFRLAVNSNDDEAFRRCVNFPARGIGATSLERIGMAAKQHGMSLWATLESASPESMGIKTGVARKIADFMELLRSYTTQVFGADAFETAQNMLVTSGLLKEYRSDTSPEGANRLQNVEELINGIREFVDNQREEGLSETPTMADYLENVSLLTDADKDMPEDLNRVSLMTVHSAKGLEFDYVFLTGLEEELFPSKMAFSTPSELEEERRLFYVGLTRAALSVTISYAQVRFRWGNLNSSSPSRFIKEIDHRFLEHPPELGMQFGMDRLAIQSGEGGTRPKSNASNPFSANPFKQFTPSIRRAGEGTELSSHDGLKPGVNVAHERFGKGVVLKLESSGDDVKAEVDFESAGKKTLLLRYAKLRVLS